MELSFEIPITLIAGLWGIAIFFLFLAVTTKMEEVRRSQELMNYEMAAKMAQRY